MTDHPVSEPLNEGERGESWTCWQRDGEIRVPRNASHDPGGKHDPAWRAKGWEPITLIPASRLEALAGELEELAEEPPDHHPACSTCHYCLQRDALDEAAHRIRQLLPEEDTDG